MNAEIQKKQVQRTKVQNVSAFLNSLSHADISFNDFFYLTRGMKSLSSKF